MTFENKRVSTATRRVRSSKYYLKLVSYFKYLDVKSAHGAFME
jgi:hypothetical protein